MLKQEIEKPYFRGHLHQTAAFVFLGACLVLTSFSKSHLASIASLVYSLCVVALFATSSIYHRIHWGPRMRQLMRRLDHAAIYLLIAGTCTPVSLLGMDQKSGFQFLIIIWSSALVGILQAVFWGHAPKWLNGIIYIVVGWLVVPYVPAIYQALGLTNVLFLFFGGVLYSVGAVIYVFRRPKLFPKTFGYHELFHLLTIIAAALHFVVVSQLVLA